MRSMKTVVLATTMLSSAAFAGADKPIIAPAPAWVKPVALPPLPDKPDEAPLRILLADQQARLEAGKIANYVDVAMQVQTPQGLSAGNMSIPWNPETDELTVHKLLIHRDGKAIDVLAGGQTFTVVRREPNLENAMLDGVLTANIQPEGLQVGDILEYAMTITRSDPVLKGHVEQTGAAWNLLPFTRTHMSVHWPSTIPVTIRQNGALPPVKAAKAGAVSRVELSMDNVQPVLAPAGAPARYSTGRVVEFSDFKSWADVGALMAPLYDVAAKVPADGSLRAELEKIKAASTDPVKRTEAALALVQDRIRYVALLMGTGGLTPAKAEETWARRYGDCKAKTALLLALLRELGVEAEPVLANAISGDGIDQRLPMVGLFNHVLVRAHIGGRVYWLDGTRTGDTSLARLRIPDFGWGLPVVAQNAALVRMLPEPLTQPDDDFAVDFDLRSGVSLPAAVKATVTLRGDDALGMRLGLANMAADARDKALRDYFKQRLDDLEIAKVSASYDAATGSELLSMEGKARMDWKDGQYWTDATWVGYEADFSRTDGTDKEAPFAVGYPTFDRTVETIQLPPGFTEQNIWRKDPIDETVGGLEYRRTSSLKDNVFRIERTVRAVAPEFAAKDAPAAQKRLKELSGLSVSVRKPDNYRITEAETQALLKEQPKTAQALIDRGNNLLANDHPADALVDFADALELEPRNALALADHGIANVWLGHYDDAGKDLDAAAAIDPKQIVIYRARGLMALKRQQWQVAVDAYTQALAINGSDLFSLGYRAQVHHALGNDTAALADADQALRGSPQWADLRALRIDIFRIQGRHEEALAEIAAYTATAPGDMFTQVRAARWYFDMKHPAEAIQAMDRAMAIGSQPFLYVLRAEIRDRSAFAEREADYDAALKLQPKSTAALAGKAHLRMDQGDMPAAVALYTQALAEEPGAVALLLARGIAHAKAGTLPEAEKDFAAARAKANDPALLNNLCWGKATEGVALETALSECDASLAKRADSAATLDSRALVLLRLGRLDDAIAAYDKALAKDPKSSSSLFGRAVAWSRHGDQAKASADLSAALRLEPRIVDRFAGFGVTMPN